MTWYSQSMQDEWVVAHIATPGFFVDLGAYDGVKTSNTKALEELGWVGICVEANPAIYQSLVASRPRSVNINAFASGSEGTVHFWDQWETDDTSAPAVPAMTLKQILERGNAPQRIQYLSMDIEGKELDVLSGFDFSYEFDLLTIEHNLYADGPAKKDAIYEILSTHGYVRLKEDVQCLDPNFFGLPYEDWYASSTFLNEQT